MNKKLWFWTWSAGGWGSAEAETAQEALVIAKAMGVTPDAKTVRLTTQGELDALDAEYKSLFLGVPGMKLCTGEAMKTFIFWNGKYSGVVKGALWDQFLINARNGHGECRLIDGDSVKDAKTHLDQCEPSPIKNVLVYGARAVTVAVSKR